MVSPTIACIVLAALMNELVVPSSAVVSNPTGTCKAEDNGARPMYHSPGPHDTYLPDCNAPLSREYWRVFAVNENSAYVIPRMDSFGMANKYGMCAPDFEVSSLLKKYGLCKEVLDSADINMLNNMKPAEALNITHALHERLCFNSQSTAGISSIVPWSPDDDIQKVCNTTIIDDGAAGYCERIMKRSNCKEACDEMAIVPSAAAIKILVPRLNKLYGTQCSGSFSKPGASMARSLSCLFSIVVLVLSQLFPLHV